MMINKILTIVLLCHSVLLFGQEQEPEDLLETDSTWKKEIFHFPLGFAPDLNYEGIEEARFPVGWGKKDSTNFWSYVFAWNIDLQTELTEQELEANLQIYFDGLMDRGEEGLKQKTTALFLKKEEAHEGSRYIGKVKVFDAFFTKESMTLHVMVDQYYCEQKKKLIVLFRFSPREFGDAVWQKLAGVKLRAQACDLRR